MKNKIILFILFGVLLPSMLYGQEKNTEESIELFPVFVEQIGKYGYIDNTGKVVIKPQFSWAREFSDGLAQVIIRKDGTSHYYYIDKTDKIVIDFNIKHTHTFDFVEGMAIIETSYIENHKLHHIYGFMNRKGEIVIKPQFARVANFSEGLARVSTSRLRSEFKHIYIDKNGNKVIELKRFQQGYDFSEGLACIQIEGEGGFGDYGYINKKGEMVIKPQFVHGSSFSEGLASVCPGPPWKYGYIDKSGKMIIEPQFDRAWPFSEGLAMIRMNGKYGYIDKSGRIVIEPQFVSPGGPSIELGYPCRFSNSRAAVAIKKDGSVKWGYIDKTGKIVIEARFDKAFPFSGELAKVTIYEKWHEYIDKTGKVIWKTPFKKY